MRPADQIIAAIEHGRRTRHRAKISPEEKAWAIEHGHMIGTTMTDADRAYAQVNGLGSGMRKRSRRTHDEIAKAIEKGRTLRRSAGLTPEEREYARKAGLYATRWSPAKPRKRGLQRFVPLNAEQRAFVEQSVGWVKDLVMRRKDRMVDHIEFDDLYQTAMLSVCLSAQKYDAASNCKFITFAYCRADFAITDYLRENVWGARRGDENHARYFLRSIDEPIDEDGNLQEIETPSFHDDLEQRVALEQIAERIYPNAKEIVRAVAEGIPAHRLAMSMGIPGGTAWGRFDRFRKFFGEEIREAISA